MKTKQEYIQELKNVKLVIGNGFDLHCGLKTKYSDFFLNDSAKNDCLKYWINEFKNQAKYYLSFSLWNHKSFWREFIYLDECNIWDFFFFIVSYVNADSQKEWLWCDVEKSIENSLYHGNKTMSGDSIYNWKYVYNILNGKANKHDDDLYILAAVAYRKNNEESFHSIEEFYSFLLSELKKFENNFGEYILNQYFTIHNGIKVENSFFYKKADLLIRNLCNINNLVSIDSFNYGFLNLDIVKGKFSNINGNTSNPIFGIDSSAFSSSEPEYIFSKTNRRMELDMLNYDYYERKEYDNVVIYGHSLTVSDYSYFFSIFDKIDIINFTKKSVIVFAYSIYDPNKKEKIKADLRSAISNLFKEYSKYKGNSEYPNRLLDGLTTQGKVLLYEV